MVGFAHAHTATGDDGVCPLGGFFKGGAQALGVVRHHAEVNPFAAHALQQATNGVAVAVVHRAFAGCLAQAQNFVASGKVGHPQALAHRHLGQPQAGQQAPGRWGEPLALAQGGLSLGNVFATQTPVVAGVHPPQGNGDALALNLHHFMRHNGVQPGRHDGPGGDAQALARLGRQPGPGRARQRVAHALQHRWLGGGQFRTGESKAIHGRVVVGRDIYR